MLVGVKAKICPLVLPQVSSLNNFKSKLNIRIRSGKFDTSWFGESVLLITLPLELQKLVMASPLLGTSFHAFLSFPRNIELD